MTLFLSKGAVKKEREEERRKDKLVFGHKFENGMSFYGDSNESDKLRDSVNPYGIRFDSRGKNK